MLKFTTAVLACSAACSLVCLSFSLDANPAGQGPLEIVFSFDTTTSMAPVINIVRSKVEELIGRLQSDIPDIRIAVFAQSEYGVKYITKEQGTRYTTTFIDFSKNVEDLKTFVREVRQWTNPNYDMPEAYERALRDVRTELSWTPGSRRALVLIGDDEPHEADYRKNVDKIDWKKESYNLRDMGVKIYAIQARNLHRADYFYKAVAHNTNGFHLRLTNFDNIFTFIMAISYRAFGLEYLKLFEEEVTYRHKTRGEIMDSKLKRLFRTLKRSQEFSDRRTTITPTRRYRPTTPTTVPTTTESYQGTQVKVQALRIRSDIAFRYATTMVESVLKNVLPTAQEVTFKVRLPDPAFISNFSMTIDGKTYHAEVKEKEKAKREYNKAKSEGKTTGHVEQTEREVNNFKVSVNVGGNDSVQFNLMYQELLERRLGMYEHRVYVDAGQIVPEFSIDVYIKESRDLSYVRVPPIQSENTNVISVTQENPMATVYRTSPNTAHIRFHPTTEDQARASSNGMQGQFVVQYDVDRQPGIGEIQVVDGYFVHYFAPPDLMPTDKNVMFVLDTSGSMHGGKLQQLKDAMLTILNDLRPNDYFNIITFSSFLRYWNKVEMVPATPKNVKEAEKFVRNFLAVGGTNINDAALRGMKFLENHANKSNSRIPSMLFFLTDGTPTDGETNKEKILENIRNKNGGNFSVFTLVFGNGVDFKLLRQMALQNKGFARKIFADSDAALQLQGFYDEVKSPLLNNVVFNYLGVDVNVSVTTETTFSNYFNGSEIIVSGFLPSWKSGANLVAQVSAQSNFGSLVFECETNLLPEEPTSSPPSTDTVGKFTENLWAYLTIKKLLDRELKLQDADEKTKLKERALQLSLKYHFVTPLTSLLVIKPDDDSTEAATTAPSVAAATTSGPRDLLNTRPRKRVNNDRGIGFVRGPSPARGAGAGGDPHFLIPVDGLDRPLCFDVTGHRGETYQLIQDSRLGLVSNGRIVSKVEHSNKTYFGYISILGRGHTIIVTPHNITIDEITYKWTKHVRHNQKFRLGEIVVTIYEQNGMTIAFREAKIKLQVVRRLVRPTHPFKVDFLGLFVARKDGFSEATDGLIGQFQHIRVEDVGGFLTFPRSSRRPLKATVLEKPNMALLKWQQCYFVSDEGRGLVRGEADDYLVPDLLFRENAVKFSRFRN